MVWQENTRIIVMTTREVEKGRVGQSSTFLTLLFPPQPLFTTMHKIKGLGGGSEGCMCLLPGLTSGVQSLGPTWEKERTDLCNFSSACHTLAVAHRYPCMYPHTDTDTPQ